MIETKVEMLVEITKEVAKEFHLIVVADKDIIFINYPCTYESTVIYRLFRSGFIRSDDPKKWLLKYPSYYDDKRVKKVIRKHIEKNLYKYPVSDIERKILYNLSKQRISKYLAARFTPDMITLHDSKDGSKAIYIDRKTREIINICGYIDPETLKFMSDWVYSFDVALKTYEEEEDEGIAI